MGLRMSMWMTSGEGSRDAAEPTTLSTPQCPRQVRRLLQLMVGDGEGLVVGEGVGCGVGVRGQAGELGHSLLGHCQKRMRREFESCEKAKQWK